MSDIANSRWLPSSPHREAILHALGQGRAHIEERGHHLSPLFVYEDGGAMELALMRVVDGRLVAVADAQLPETSPSMLMCAGPWTNWSACGPSGRKSPTRPRSSRSC